MKFIKGTEVYIPGAEITGIVMSTDEEKGTAKVLTSDGIIEVATNLMQLWKSLSWLTKLLIVLFKKKR